LSSNRWGERPVSRRRGVYIDARKKKMKLLRQGNPLGEEYPDVMT
jgi:hypothetical protein